MEHITDNKKQITKNIKQKKLLSDNCYLITDQKGQSLIETVGAIFILTMALTTGLGLAVYAFSKSAISQNEIMAVNLAREGIDVVRMMRDSNWLASDIKGAAWDLVACADVGGKLCYPRTYEKVPPYNEYDLIAGNQRLVFDPATHVWSLNAILDYNLYLQADGTYTHTDNGSTSNFARMVNISFNSALPYTNQNSNQELILKSAVAWRGKNCTEFSINQNLLTLETSCKIVTEEHMTNWKDYK